MIDPVRRPGYGLRHPELSARIRTLKPIASTIVHWGADRELPIRLCGYAGIAEVPQELVSSIRCIVRADDGVVLCTNDHETHPWPGGRREPGELWADTACREVLEETGWSIDRDSLRPVGWLHYEYLTERPSGWPYPHPDFIQIIFVADADDRLRVEAGGWTDAEGWERSSELVGIAEACTLVHDPVARAFLELID